MKKTSVCAFWFAISLFLCGASLSIPVYSQSAQSKTQGKTDLSLLQGYEAYRKHDWKSAIIFFRKSVSNPQSATDETYYMLVMSEMYAGEYEQAFTDSSFFIRQFPGSRYLPYVEYQNGRALHYLGKNEDAVLVLSDFCHKNPENELYASALYWIAESFYAEYNFDSARALYERIIIDFPSDSKVTDSRYRIEMIEQRAREEKLIYLLKVTGEESLAAREDFERRIKQYQTEDRLGLRQQLAQANAKIEELEAQLEQERLAAAQAAQAVLNVPEEIQTQKLSDPEVEALKRKAIHLQFLIDEQRAEEQKAEEQRAQTLRSGENE